MLKYVNNMSRLYFSAKLEDTKQPLPLLLVLPYSVEEGEEDNNDNGVEEGEEDNNDNVDSGRIMGVM